MVVCKGVLQDSIEEHSEETSLQALSGIIVSVRFRRTPLDAGVSEVISIGARAEGAPQDAFLGAVVCIGVVDGPVDGYIGATGTTRPGNVISVEGMQVGAGKGAVSSDGVCEVRIGAPIYTQSG